MAAQRERHSKHLTRRESIFFQARILEGLTLETAYRAAWPDREPKNPTGAAWAVQRRIKRKLGAQTFLQRLEEADLGEERLFRKIAELLEAKRTEFFQGAAVADCADNGTRARITELLAELLGVRKGQLDLHHSGPDGDPLLPGSIVVRLVEPPHHEPTDGSP